MKTFWGWRDEQFSDGPLVWQSPAGQRCVTQPGSRWLFPALCAPTRPVELAEAGEHCVAPEAADRSARMPRRVRARARQRAIDIAAERRLNHEIRTMPVPPYAFDDAEFENYLEWVHSEKDGPQDAIPPPF